MAHATGYGTAVTAQIYPLRPFNVVGYARFNDPQGFDSQVVLTDDWRDGGGEDGGCGRAWLIISGNAPRQIPLNGNDVYGPSRLVPCYNGLVLLRQDNERHYFPGPAATASAQIQLNAAAGWNNGDLVLFYAFAGGSFTPAVSSGSVPNPNTRYYVKNISGNKVELYTDAALTTKLNFIAASGKFYLERQADFPGFYGNGAPPLLAQPNVSGNTIWDKGFASAPAQVFITGVLGNVVTAPNHRLLPGDAVAVTVITLSGGGAVPATVYAAPSSANTLKLYDTAINALAAGATGLQALTDNPTPTGATITKVGASKLPMPSGREGCYFQGRLVVVNGRDTLAVSDPLDPLHFAPFTAAVTANMGESDFIQAVVPVPAQDSLLILKQNSVLILQNFSQGSGAWTLGTVTREYGCYAPLSVAQVGSDVWFLSRKGVASVLQTVQGVTQGVAEPVSKPMKRYLDLIDWRAATVATAVYWNNRFYIAVPLKGQTGTPINNGWLVFNFLLKNWEGLWQGTALAAAGMSRLGVYGEERMTFVSTGGQVSWLGDGFTDGAAPIADSFTTRIYTGGSLLRKLHLAAEFIWDAYAPSLTVTAITPGVNENETLLPAPLTYDSHAYFAGVNTSYTPGVNDFNAPYRESYTMSDAELLAGQPDLHQNISESFRMRLDDWGVQFTVVNTQGSCRIQSVSMRAVAGPHSDFAQV